MIKQPSKSSSVFSLLAALLLSALVFSASPLRAQVINTQVIAMNAGADPCQNPTIQKLGLKIGISSAATTQLIALSGTKKVYACNFTATIAGTTPSITFWTGDTTTPTNGSFSTATTGGVIPLSTTYFYRISGTNAPSARRARFDRIESGNRLPENLDEYDHGQRDRLQRRERLQYLSRSNWRGALPSCRSSR